MTSNVIFWEFVSSLFGIFVLISLVGGGWIGYILGYRQYGIVTLIFICPIIWLFQAFLVFGFDTGIQTLFYIGRTGAQAGIGWILNANLILHPSVALIGVLFGKSAFSVEVSDIRRRGLNLKSDDVLHMLTVLSSHPELAAAGWFASRWAQMDDAERRTWVNHKIRKLRELWMLGFDYDEDGGFEAYGVNLPMKLAAIDTGAGTDGQMAVRV